MGSHSTTNALVVHALARKPRALTRRVSDVLPQSLERAFYMLLEVYIGLSLLLSDEWPGSYRLKLSSTFVSTAFKGVPSNRRLLGPEGMRFEAEARSHASSATRSGAWRPLFGHMWTILNHMVVFGLSYRLVGRCWFGVRTVLNSQAVTPLWGC